MAAYFATISRFGCAACDWYKTWAPELGGRRLPYLLVGMIFAVVMMLILPNIGSLGLGYGSIAALVFGAIAIAILDVSANNGDSAV